MIFSVGDLVKFASAKWLQPGIPVKEWVGVIVSRKYNDNSKSWMNDIAIPGSGIVNYYDYELEAA